MIEDIERLLKESSENVGPFNDSRYRPSKRRRSPQDRSGMYDNIESQYHQRKRMKMDMGNRNNQRYPPQQSQHPLHHQQPQEMVIPAPQYSNIHQNLQMQQRQIQQQQQSQVVPPPQMGGVLPPKIISEETKAQRTIFITNLKPTVSERDIRQFFGASRVLDIILIKDRRTGISKGSGYVEFSDVPSTRQALGLHGQLIQGYPVFVKMSQTAVPMKKKIITPLLLEEKVKKKTKTEIKRVFVRNFPEVLDEEDIRYIFETVGIVENVEIKRGRVGIHDKPYCLRYIKRKRKPKKRVKEEEEEKEKEEKDSDDNIRKEEEEDIYIDESKRKEEKYGFVEFRFSEDATKSLIRLNNLHLGMGRRLEVGMWNDQPSEKHIDLLDDGRSRGIRMTREARSNLMKEIAGGVMMKEEEQKRKQQLKEEEEKKKQASLLLLSGGSSQGASENMGMAQRPTKNVVLHNMFDLNSKDLNFEEILEDVKEEVSNYGTLDQIFLDKSSVKGEIYLRYRGIQDATNARTNLKGRSYDGKKINVVFIEDDDFFKKFKECP